MTDIMKLDLKGPALQKRLADLRSAREALIEEIKLADVTLTPSYATALGENLLAALNRKGWRLVQKAEADL